jgi:ketosteroid isomerase-like protein
MDTMDATDVVASFFASLMAGRYSEAVGLLDDDIFWRIPGRNPLAGERRGRDSVLDYLRELADLGGHDLHTEVGGLLGDDSHVVIWLTRTSQLASRPLVTRECQLFEVKGGRITEFIEYHHDQYALDRWFSDSR